MPYTKRTRTITELMGICADCGQERVLWEVDPLLPVPEEPYLCYGCLGDRIITKSKIKREQEKYGSS